MICSDIICNCGMHTAGQYRYVRPQFKYLGWSTYDFIILTVRLLCNVKAHEAFAEYQDLLEELDGRLSSTDNAEGT